MGVDYIKCLEAEGWRVVVWEVAVVVVMYLNSKKRRPASQSGQRGGRKEGRKEGAM